MMKFLLAFFFTLPAFAQLESDSIYIGQQVIGSTIGAPLSVDLNGQLVSGELVPTFIGASGTITVATAAFTTMTSLALVPNVSGAYQVHCRTSVQHATNNADIFMAVFVSGTIVFDSLAQARPFIQGGVTPSLAVPMVLYTNTEVSVPSGATVDCRWRTTAGTATSTPTRSLMIERKR